MVTMLLASTLRGATHAVDQLAPSSPRTVTYIPTAGTVEPWGGLHAAANRRMLRRMGFAVDEVDIATAAPADIRRALERNAFVCVSGGNTFFLMQELRRTGADAMLSDRVRAGTPYIGESAGAVVTAPSIAYCADMDSTDKAPDLNDYAGLGLVDFHVVPHRGNLTMGRAAMRIVDRYAGTLDMRVLTDRQSVLVKDGQARTLTA